MPTSTDTGTARLTRISVVVLAVGLVLLVLMVTTEGEPGALPLGLVVLGLGGLLAARLRARRS